MANAGAFNLRQIILGTFDQRIHTTGQADTTDIFSQTYMEILGIETIPGTNMPANFGHMVGYDSQYYGYLVSLLVVFFAQKILAYKGLKACNKLPQLLLFDILVFVI